MGVFTTESFISCMQVGNIGECYDLCCQQSNCNLAFMLGQNCFSVKCTNKDLCSTIPAQPSIYNPQIAYVYNRKAIEAKSDGKLHGLEKRKLRFRSSYKRGFDSFIRPLTIASRSFVFDNGKSEKKNHIIYLFQ